MKINYMNRLMVFSLFAVLSIMAAVSMSGSAQDDYTLTQQEREAIARMKLPYSAYDYATIGSTADDSAYVANNAPRICSYGTCWGE